MTRTLAVLGFLFSIAMVILSAIVSPDTGRTTMESVSIYLAVNLIGMLIIILYCGFAALHATARVQDPHDRIGWLVWMLVFNIFGSLIYYLTKYQDFKKHGLGALPKVDKKETRTLRAFFSATPSELELEATDNVKEP